MRRYAIAAAAAIVAIGLPAAAGAAWAQAAIRSGAMFTAAEITLVLFTVTNSARILAYVPQIWKAMTTDANGARGISCFTWVLFLVSNLTTVAYAIVNLGDWIMAAIFTGSALGCIAIISVAVWRRPCNGRE